MITDRDTGDEHVDRDVKPGNAPDCDCTEMYMGDIHVPLPCYLHASQPTVITEAEVRAALAAGAMESAAYRRVMPRRGRW